MNWKQKHSSLRDRVFKKSRAETIDAFDKQVTRLAAKGMTAEEALFVLAHRYKVSDIRAFGKLLPESRQRISNQINTHTAINTTNNVNTVRHTLHFNNSNVNANNIVVGSRSRIKQSTILNVKEVLVELFDEVDKSDKLTEEQKREYRSDIQTIASQTEKKQPNRTIVQTAWESVRTLADIEGFTQFITRIAPLLQHFIS